MKDKNKELVELKDVPIVWDSGLKILSPKILLDFNILEIAESIQRRIGNNEFSILFKGMWDYDGFCVTSEYMIPDQHVSSVSVDFEDDISKYRYKGYNTILHSHPFSCASFSYNDEKSINVHFDCSLLFSINKIVAGTICIRLDDERKLKIPITDIGFITKDHEVTGMEKVKTLQMKEGGLYGFLGYDKE